MKGIHFVVDDQGNPKSVLIDLEAIREIWEDIYDILVAHTQRNEPKVSWAQLKAELQEELASEKSEHGEVRGSI